MFLRRNTAKTVSFGPMLDATDGVTAETALTIPQANRKLSKGGAAYAQSSTTGNATHQTDGNYQTTLSATDTNTVGILKLSVTVSGAAPIWENYFVIHEDAYDALTATFAEPGQGAPPSTTTVWTMLRYLYKRLINKVTNDGSNDNLYNAAGTVVDQKSPTTQVGGVTTNGPMQSGP